MSLNFVQKLLTQSAFCNLFNIFSYFCNAMFKMLCQHCKLTTTDIEYTTIR